MAAHPNVTINITVLENEAFKTKLTTVLQSGTPPDIFQSWGGGDMNSQVQAGLLQDITPALDANGGAWRNTFGAGTLSVYAYQGKNYGVPWDMGMVGFWYNKDLFTKAGITDTPATWTDFLADVKKLKALVSHPSLWAKGISGPVCISGCILLPASAVSLPLMLPIPRRVRSRIFRCPGFPETPGFDRPPALPTRLPVRYS